jgi:hypothetical protein
MTKGITVMQPLITGFKNIKFYFKTIFRDRFWDYSFIYILLDKKLEQLENNWSKNTFGENDKKVLTKIKELRSLVQQLIQDDFLTPEENSYFYKAEPLDTEENLSKNMLYLSKLEHNRRRKTKRLFFYKLYMYIDEFWD